MNLPSNLLCIQQSRTNLVLWDSVALEAMLTETMMDTKP